MTFLSRRIYLFLGAGFCRSASGTRVMRGVPAGEATEYRNTFKYFGRVGGEAGFTLIRLRACSQTGRAGAPWHRGPATMKLRSGYPAASATPQCQERPRLT